MVSIIFRSLAQLPYVVTYALLIQALVNGIKMESSDQGSF